MLAGIGKGTHGTLPLDLEVQMDSDYGYPDAGVVNPGYMRCGPAVPASEDHTADDHREVDTALHS